MKTILVLSPHPDDEAIGCGGTIRQHVTDGDAVHVTFLTSGEAGGIGGEEDLGAIREREAEAAGEILGVKELEFWREPDGAVGAGPRLVDRLVGRIQDLAADTIYVTHDREMHADHQIAAILAYRALLAVSMDGPADLPSVLMYEVWTPLQELDHIVDITEHMETKLEAVRAHKTQCDIMPFDAAIEGLNRYRGEFHSWPGGPYAEVFRSLDRNLKL